MLDELAHPIDTVAHSLLVKLNTKVGQVNNGDSVSNTRVVYIHAHVGHVRTERIFSLFKRDVYPAGLSVEDGIVEHGKGETGFHCTRRTSDNADVALGDTALHFFI